MVIRIYDSCAHTQGINHTQGVNDTHNGGGQEHTWGGNDTDTHRGGGKVHTHRGNDTHRWEDRTRTKRKAQQHIQITAVKVRHNGKFKSQHRK